MNLKDRIGDDILATLRETIEEAGFNEVLFVGRVDSSKKITSIVIAARGNQNEVPALKPYMEKGDVVIHNHPSGGLYPSSADLLAASNLGNQGIGFYIVNNAVTEVYVVAEPITVKEKVSLSPLKLSRLLKPDGALSRFIDSYEVRGPQIEMLKTVIHSFNNNRICAAEAGTGVGKSLAYLIPAVKWVEENDERVVVSTATINLQQQLVEKDIPLVLKILNSKVQCVLVKGRGNYLCLKRLQDVIEENSLFKEADSEIARIKDWSLNSPTGCRSDLSFFLEEIVWGRICSEADSCLGLRCRFREDCFLLKARKEAASARVLVANHHLLFSDLSLRIAGYGFDGTAVLPPFHRIILDEAHNIEDCATSFFSEDFHKFSVQKQIGRVFRSRKGRNVGLSPGLQGVLGPHSLLKNIPPMVTAALHEAELLEDAGMMFIGNSSTLRLSPQDPPKQYADIITAIGNFQSSLIELLDLLSGILDCVADEDSDAPVVFETRLIMRRLEKTSSICEKFKNFQDKDDYIFWLEKKFHSMGTTVRFVITPLDISDLMREAVYEPHDTVVCTSATLTVADSFDFWKSRVGLTDYEIKKTRYSIFPSPFPYREHVYLGVPNDAPMPNDGEYIDFINDFIFKTLELSEGKGLVLFTSYEMLKSSYGVIKPKLNGSGISVFRQGDEDRSRLLKKFHQDTGSVLFATDSFWEGIDVPGESLKVVIICRLPFKVPSDPVNKARLERIEKMGGNPFIKLSLPEAVMKLKQGFGRLIRRTSDRGVVLILDPRIAKKNYGKVFLKSLPETQLGIKPKAALLQDIENFLYP